MYELGELLKRLRGDLSLREVAKRSGLSYSYISSLEKGKHPKTGAPINPTPDSLRSLAKAYNYPYVDLMKLAGYSAEDDYEKAEEINKTNFLVSELVKQYGIDLSIEGEKENLEKFIKLYVEFRKS